MRVIVIRERRGSYTRVNVYSEEMTDRVEIVEKKINGQTFTGVRFYLELPVTVKESGLTKQIKGPFLYGGGSETHLLSSDDDSSAVTFWGKRDMRKVLFKALNMLDNYYECKKVFDREKKVEG